VVNEYGAVGLDQSILALAPGAAQVALLGNGCLCCTVRSDLEASLRALHADRMAGRTPPFRRLVLELSGADDPLPVIQTLLSPRALGTAFHLQAVVAVVSAAAGPRALTEAPEAARQIALADRIVLTKVDLAETVPMERAIEAINPTAPIAWARGGTLSAPGFLTAEGVIAAPPARRAEAVAHVAGLASFTLRFERAFAWPELAATLHLLAELRGADLLRVKGLVAVEDRPGPVVIQAAQHLLHPPVELAAWPDAEGARLTFITRGGLGEAAVAALFAAVAGLR